MWNLMVMFLLWIRLTETVHAAWYGATMTMAEQSMSIQMGIERVLVMRVGLVLLMVLCLIRGC